MTSGSFPEHKSCRQLRQDCFFASKLPQLPVSDRRTSRLDATAFWIPVNAGDATNSTPDIVNHAPTSVADFADVPVANADDGDSNNGVE